MGKQMFGNAKQPKFLLWSLAIDDKYRICRDVEIRTRDVAYLPVSTHSHNFICQGDEIQTRDFATAQ